MVTKWFWKYAKAIIFLSNGLVGAAALANDKIDERHHRRDIALVGGAEKIKKMVPPVDKNSVSQGLMKLDNKFFSVLYPNCFSVLAQGDEDSEGVNGAPGIEFRSKLDCLGENRLSEKEFLYVGIALVPLKSLEKIPHLGNLLLEKKNKINDVPAVKIFTSIESCVDKKCEIRLNRKVHLICKNRTFVMASEVMQEDGSKELIDRGDFGFPTSFQKIIDSFRCK